MTDEPLWVPPAHLLQDSNMARFARRFGARIGRELDGQAALHAESVAHGDVFWDEVWDACGVVGEKGGRIRAEAGRMSDTRFFPDARLNFAENLLRETGNGDAIVFNGEGRVTRRLSWDDLHAAVSRAQQAFLALGLKPGDRVAAMLPNMPEAVIAMLAASTIGAVWCSCSPDFGARGVLDRFGQIAPKFFIGVDGYWYNGKRIDVTAKLAEIVPQMPSVAATLVVPYLGDADLSGIPHAHDWNDALAEKAPRPVAFTRLPFDHPLYILFSSGTTGVPKCIVHAAGRVLIQHVKEHQLHCDERPGDRAFYFTTCGWMMWNWLVSALSSRATLLLFDGSPFAPEPAVLFDYAQAERATLFGTSAKYIDACLKAGLRPAQTHDLSALRLITSTGSPLSAQGFDYVYAAIKPDVQLASISGGTDIVSCFVLGTPLKPVRRGEIQGPGLGLAVSVWRDDGTPAAVGEKGELVCTAPFPAMPTGFWNDADGARYRAAYFERFDDVWCHGDFAEWTEHGGLVIHGRSDATLNPGGVRIGTAEIYAQVEAMPEIAEAIAIGQEWEGDVRIVLFVRLAEGASLDDALAIEIRRRIREGASPRHVPARILAVADIPRTKSGKIVELAVRDVVHGRPISNAEALANPDALALYRERPELAV